VAGAGRRGLLIVPLRGLGLGAVLVPVPKLGATTASLVSMIMMQAGAVTVSLYYHFNGCITRHSRAVAYSLAL